MLTKNIASTGFIFLAYGYLFVLGIIVLPPIIALVALIFLVSLIKKLLFLALLFFCFPLVKILPNPVQTKIRILFARHLDKHF